MNTGGSVSPPHWTGRSQERARGVADGAAWPCGRGARRPPTGTAVSPHEEAESASVLCDNDSEPRGFPC